MVEHPPTSHQAHYIAGPSSNDTRPTSSSVYRPSTNPGFWTSTSARTTYASYKSHPGAWEANYLSTVDDFKLFSFGRPDATPDDERWNITMREGDETSSSSSDDGESRRRARGKSRDVTPRASLVSLDVLASHSDSHSRSHPSQLQQINYYHRGTDVTGNKNSDIHFHYDEDHHHPSELQESNNEQARRLRSDISIYSYDTGYDAASSYRSGSRTGSYAPSYTSSQVRDRAEAEAEAISISSSRPASSGTSGLMLDGEFDPDDFSISSARRSFSFDANSEQYGGAGQLSDVLRLSDSERMSLDSATSSYMHVSVSSLRFDGESQGVALDQHNQTENPRESITGVSAVPIASNNQNLAPPSQRTRPRSLSTSAAAASLPSSSTLYTTAAPNAAVAGFDLTYITSGLSLNANATSHTYVPHPALEDLDFVRKTSTVNRGDLRGAERGEQVGRGVPMGWEDDYTIPTPFINITPERKRTRAATVTAAVGSTPGILAHTNINSGPPPRRNVQSTSAGVKNPIARSRSPSQSRHKHSSSSLHKDLTALLDQSEINSANGMLNAARIHDSLLSVPPGAVRRKRSAFANLTALGIGSSSSGLSSSHTEETEDEMTHSKPPVSPVSPARTIKGEAQRKELEPERYNTDHSIFSAVTPGLSKITKSGSSSESRDGASGAVVDSSSSFSMSHSHPSSSVPLSLSTRTPSPVGHTSPKLHDSPQVLSPPSGKLSAPRDDALTLMVRGDPDRVGTKWAWVIQKERKEDVFNVMDLSGSIQVGLDHGIKNEQKEKEPTYKGKEILREVWTGMSVGSEEVWENYLLGRFSVLRDDHDGNTRTGGKTSTAPDTIIRPKSSGGGGGKVVDGGADVNVLGFRVPVGKPPQQRLIIKHLREDKVEFGHPGASGLSQPQTKIPEPATFITPKNQPSSSQRALHSQLLHSSTSETKPPTAVTYNRPSRHDNQHPSILVHKHSKVAAFSISRQHRASTKESKESSSGRLHVIMLAPRDVQEAFTDTATTKKLGTVLDRHEAARAAFTPGLNHPAVKEKDGKPKAKKHGSLYSPFRGKYRSTDGVGQVKSDGQIEHVHYTVDSGELGQSVLRSSDMTASTGLDRDKIGTRSAPAYDRPYEANINDIRARNESLSRENHKRAYGTLEHPPSSFTTTPTSSKSSRIFKRFLPWELSSSSPSTSSHGSSSKATSSTGSTITMTQSASTRDTTPTQSTGSDISMPYSPPWVTLPSREHQEIRRNVLGQLENSFEQVGLLPAKDKDRDRTKNNIDSKRGREAQVGSILPKLHKKSDVLSSVPADAFFMLVPLWPAETDVYSQRLSPFHIPSIPVESRRYLLVSYKPQQREESSRDSTTYDTRLKILLPGFHVIARQVSHQELQGTGVRLPEQGISVSGSLEDAFAQMPGSNEVALESDVATSSSSSSTSPPTPQLSVIASCNTRDAGLEFDPLALIELGLCRVLSSRELSEDSDSIDDTEQSMTVKLTPIGSAVMEMVWVGGLALSSFGS